jgi:hypothetical protein
MTCKGKVGELILPRSLLVMGRIQYDLITKHKTRNRIVLKGIFLTFMLGVVNFQKKSLLICRVTFRMNIKGFSTTILVAYKISFQMYTIIA